MWNRRRKIKEHMTLGGLQEKKKIKEAGRQNELHQRAGKKNNAFTSLSKGIKPPKGSVPLNKVGRDEMKNQTIKILNRPHCKLKALALIRNV